MDLPRKDTGPQFGYIDLLSPVAETGKTLMNIDFLHTGQRDIHFTCHTQIAEQTRQMEF